MGYKTRFQEKHLSPWTMLQIIYRAQQGEPVSCLAREFRIGDSSIYRWRKRWGHEAYKVRVQHATEDVAALHEIAERLAGQAESAVNQLSAIDSPEATPEELAAGRCISRKLVRQVTLASEQLKTMSRRFSYAEHSLAFPYAKAEPVRQNAPDDLDSEARSVVRRVGP